VQEDTGVRPVTWWKSPADPVRPGHRCCWSRWGCIWNPTLTASTSRAASEVLHSFTALLIALSLYTAAFIAEIVRAGILAISAGRPRRPLRLACARAAR
jgi:general L-amino acid transport system permease protein